MNVVVFTKDELARIVRKAMCDAGITDQGEMFVRAVAAMMYDVMCSLEE